MNRVERVYMEEMWLNVATAALHHRHPQAQWIVDHSRGLPIPLSDNELEAAVERVGVWLADQPEIPIHPDSEFARRARAAEEAALKDA